MPGKGARPTRAEYVRDSLLSELRAGKWTAGEKLPNEDELAERFDVSRATVREAIRGLLEIGHLTRRHGFGTFVTSMPSHQHSLDTTLSYTAMIRDAGMTPGETVLSRTERQATLQEADRLRVDPGAPLLFIQRVRTADGVPAVYSEDRIPAAALAGLARVPPTTSLYVLLGQAGLAIHHALATVRPVIADSRLARLLSVPRGSALQYIDQVDFTAGGQAAMLSSEWHVPGVFELSVYRRPPLAGADD